MSYEINKLRKDLAEFKEGLKERHNQKGITLLETIKEEIEANSNTTRLTETDVSGYSYLVIGVRATVAGDADFSAEITWRVAGTTIHKERPQMDFIDETGYRFYSASSYIELKGTSLRLDIHNYEDIKREFSVFLMGVK